MNPTIIDIHSYKGGVGVTTTACAIAVRLANEGRKTLIVDGSETGDCYAWLGLTTPDSLPISALENLTIIHANTANTDKFVGVLDAHGSLNYDFVVVDNGRNSLNAYQPFTSARVCVVRNDYLTLRNTVKNFSTENDLCVAVITEGAALRAEDVQAVLGNSIPVVVAHDPAVQRAIDAGLAPTRTHLFSWTDEVVSDILERVPPSQRESR